jgi:mono/diheme cytochrome c family protein
MKHAFAAPALFMLALVPAAMSAAHGADLNPSVRRFLDSHCVDCHNADEKKGGLDLAALAPDFADPVTFGRWVRIHDRVKAGEMPPPEVAAPTNAVEPQTVVTPDKAVPAKPAAATPSGLSEKDRDQFIKDLAYALNASDTNRQRTEGRVPLRRLNRTEYENTLRDLFSMPGLEVKELLPEDGRAHGFDKAGEALEISPVQLRKYLEAADYVLDEAIAHEDKPMVFKERFRRVGGLAQFCECSFPIVNRRADMASIEQIAPRAGRNTSTVHMRDYDQYLQRMDSLGILTHARPSYDCVVENFSPFHSGFYRIKTRVWGFKYNKGEIGETDRNHSIALTADGRVLGYVDAPSMKPTEHELVVWLNEAETLELNPADLWPNFNHVYNHEGPGIAVDYIDVEGPLHEAWPPASHKRLFGNLPIVEVPYERDQVIPRQPVKPQRRPGFRPHHTDGKEFQKNQPIWTAAAARPKEDARRLLKDFLPRAFRRPVPDSELEVYVKIAHERIEADDYFENAMRAAYRLALCSPDFLFIQEVPGAASPTDKMALDNYAVASRLSYFLWNSMPDDELLALAAKNQLHGATLTRQFDRMLADPKSDRFVDDFLDQWLDLREINFTSPEARLYPEFRPDLRDAMLVESRAFFRELLDHDLGVSNVIDSNFLMLNQRLAEHYKIRDVTGSAIRRITRPQGSPYGGFLTQAAVLKVTANGTTTSPVLRGAWIMDRILGRPVPPPPPDIPAVDPDVRGTVTVRQQLDAHRNSAACAGCHAKMDPPGFALENFDVIGGWRTLYRFTGEPPAEGQERRGKDPQKNDFGNVLPNQWIHVMNNVRFGLPVDASGTTVDGRPFKNVTEFKKILAADEEAVARNLVERLILYGTGAEVSFADRAQVDQVLAKSRDGHFGLRSLVHEVINTNLFRRK